MSAPTTTSSQQHIFRKLLKHRSATIGASIILFFIAVAIFAPLIATHDPRQANIVERLQGGSALHYLGTDKVGRDIFSRIVYGTRISLKVGLVAMTFSVGFGTLFGAIAGYYGGRLDNLIMRVMDMMLAMPSILLAMVIVTILGQSLTNAIIAVSIVYIPQYARILRASVLKVRELDYVVAAEGDWGEQPSYPCYNCASKLSRTADCSSDLRDRCGDFRCGRPQFLRTRCGDR